MPSTPVSVSKWLASCATKPCLDMRCVCFRFFLVRNSSIHDDAIATIVTTAKHWAARAAAQLLAPYASVFYHWPFGAHASPLFAPLIKTLLEFSGPRQAHVLLFNKFLRGGRNKCMHSFLPSSKSSHSFSSIIGRKQSPQWGQPNESISLCQAPSEFTICLSSIHWCLQRVSVIPTKQFPLSLESPCTATLALS